MRAVLFLMGFAGGVAAAADPPADKALEPFQGKWEIVEATERGRAGDREKLKMFPVTFAGNQMEMIYEGKKTAKWTVTVRPDKDPKEIDADLPAGDRSMRGIYRFEDGALRIAFGLNRETPRPEKFESTGGARPTLVMVLKKVK